MKQTTSERVDDLPLIIYWLSQMGIERLIDQELPRAHGNRQGLSYGQLAVLLLSYIITQADHRLCAVELWVSQHQTTLELATGWKIGDKDATDDRLADLLSVLGSSEHEALNTIETCLGQQLIRAYELPTSTARSDTTSFSVYHHQPTLSEQEGFEIPLGSLWLNPESQQWHRWSERWLVIRSHALAQRQIRGLEQRLCKAKKALASLASKPGQDVQALQEKLDRILQHHRVSEYLNVTINKQIRYPKVYQGSGRPSQQRPCRRVRQTTLTLNYQRQETKIAAFSTLAGWRLYVTNALTERLSLEEAVSCYREQWQPERGFHLFKRGRLPALPIYFQDESRIRGLMFLLTIALRLFTLMEFVVRRQLADQQKSVAGLYDGNQWRTTNRPTAERLLAAFCGITWYFHRDGSTEISPLNCLQQEILKLMTIPVSIYTLPVLVPK